MYFGVDGCRGGWLAIGLAPGRDTVSLVCETFGGLMAALERPRLVLVDMPIGLPSAAVPDRVCDRAARAVLGRRGSSVFPVPSRAALSATDYAAACDINARELGKRLSRQTWNISDKIREVDDYLLGGSVRCRIREMHPEVAFAALNGGAPLAAGKKRPDGRAARLALLERELSGAGDVVARVRAAHAKQTVADDDILDALVGAVVARHGDALQTLPPQPRRDAHGITMEIVLPPGPRRDSNQQAQPETRT